jgi:tryptophan 2,3-dioxygenase
MSFGLPRSDSQLTYGGYLKIQELTSLQKLLSDPPQHDEMLFIVIHQIYELWFKELLNEIDGIIQRLLNGDILGAHRLLRRCIEIERVLVSQVAVLETMTPVDFLNFRDELMPASGFQSAQFREIEIASGLKEPRFLAYYPKPSEEYSRLESRLNAPSMRDAFDDLLRHRGFSIPDEQAGSDPAAHRSHMIELSRIFLKADLDYPLFLLAESLIEYDEMFALWRLRHVKMVERMIGTKTGTGGSEGAEYLKKTVDRMFFPALWEVRTYLSKKSEASEQDHKER